MGWPGRARAGSGRSAANSPRAPPPGALPGKPLLPAPLQTAGQRRRGVTEAAASRVRRVVGGSARVGRGSARFQSAFPPLPLPLRGTRPERLLRGLCCRLAAQALVAAALSRSRQVQGAWGQGRRLGFALGSFWMPRLKAVHATAAPYWVRPRLVNAGGCGGGCVREVPRARPLAAGVEGTERLGRWHRPYSGHQLVGGGGSQAGPVAPENVQGVDVPGTAACSARRKLRRDAGECIGGKVGEGGFSRKRAGFL